MRKSQLDEPHNLPSTNEERSGRLSWAVPDQPMTSASDFNAKRGFMVRSEGGRICCDFKGLPAWTKTFGAFSPHKCLSRRTPTSWHHVGRDSF
jgi:hypothetical protein